MGSNSQDMGTISGPSGNSTIPATPEHSHPSKVAVVHAPSVDSGYGTATSTTPDPWETPSQPCRITGRPIPGTARYGNLHQYDRPVSPTTIDRYTAISMQLQPAIVDYMRKHYRVHMPIVMRLMVFGQTADTAKPGIVIFCHDEREKRVRRFFSKAFARNLCAPKQEAEHAFQVIVLPLPINMLGSDELLVWTDATCINKTLSGAPILVSLEVAQRGTLGGLVTVRSEDGSHHVLGLTAAHITRPLASAESDLDSSDDESISASSDDEDVLAAVDHFTSGDERSISSDDEGALAADPLVMSGPNASLDSDEPPSMLVQDAGAGTVDGVWHLRKAISQTEASHPAPQISDDDPDVVLGFTGWAEISHTGQLQTAVKSGTLDWALVTVDTELLKPNRLRCATAMRVPDTDLTVVTAERLNSSLDRYVKLNVARDEQQEGKLIGLPSSMWLERTGGFVRAFPLEMEGTSELQRGDSGAWVVDHTLQVYGHLAAADALGDGYVVPLLDTLESIRETTHSEAVHLATTIDMMSEQFSLASSEVLQRLKPKAFSMEDDENRESCGFNDSGYGSREPSKDKSFSHAGSYEEEPEQMRLVWDEANLYLSEQDTGGRMKITERKGQYNFGDLLEEEEEEDGDEDVAIDPRYVEVDEVDVREMKKPLPENLPKHSASTRKAQRNSAVVETGVRTDAQRSAPQDWKRGLEHQTSMDAKVAEAEAYQQKRTSMVSDKLLTDHINTLKSSKTPSRSDTDSNYSHRESYYSTSTKSSATGKSRRDSLVIETTTRSRPLSIQMPGGLTIQIGDEPAKRKEKEKRQENPPSHYSYADGQPSVKPAFSDSGYSSSRPSSTESSNSSLQAPELPPVKTQNTVHIFER